MSHRFLRLLPVHLVVLTFLALAWSPAADSQTNEVATRKALVIGNNVYRNVASLRNAKSDAEAVAESLRSLGFAVTLRTNIGEKDLKASVREFVNSLDGGDEAVFYFAGHGVQFGAANYLLPVDVAAEDEGRVRDESLPLQRVLDDLTDRKVRFSLAIVDACRNNPFPSGRLRSIPAGRGLAPTNPATGQMVMFSAGAGQTALDLLDDRDKNRNGVFTRVLLRELEKDGLAADQVLRNVRDEVVRLARSVNHEQVPALYDQSIGRFYFRAASRVVGVNQPLTASSSEVVPTAQPSQSRDSTERLFWESIKDSKNPDEFKAYLRRYPSGVFAELAQVRLRSTSVSAADQSAPMPLTSSSSAQDTPSGRSKFDESEWIAIAGGVFKSGPGNEAVNLKAFKINKNEISNRKYAEFLSECPAGDSCGPRSLPPYWGDEDYVRLTFDNPVVFVAWDDAAAFCRWAESRLPTATEWEKAARGVNGNLYPSGMQFSANAVNLLGADNRTARRNAAPRQIPTWAITDPRYGADRSEYGVLGMAGNVSEWTSTSSGAKQEMRLVAGGSWDSWETTDALAYQTIPKKFSDKSSSLGFRCARD